MPAAASRRWVGLGSRVLAGAIFVPAFLVIAWRGEPYFVLLVNSIALAGTWEFARMVAAKGVRPYRALMLAGAVLLPWLAYLQDGRLAGVGLAMLLLAILTAALFRRGHDALVAIAASALGVLYVGWLASHLVLLRELPHLVASPYASGFHYVSLVLLLTWAADTGAYVVGSAAGRHKLAPRISPAKSLEGAVGGVALAVVAGTAASATFLEHEIGAWTGALLGVLAAVFGLAGDLAESLLKRDAHVKDASTAIPGHGGVLDRFDSVLFTAPLLYYVLRFVVL